MLYRFTLDSITCRHQRSADEYRDALAVAFVIWDGDNVKSEMSSPLGLTGPNRYSPLFGPGTEVSLDPDPNRFGVGFDKPWAFDIDVPDDGANIRIEVVLVNIRGVDDPYGFSKLVTSLAAAAALGAAGGAAGEKAKDALGAVLAGGLGGAVGEGAKKVLDWAFGDDWPKCTGHAFHYEESIDLPMVRRRGALWRLDSKRLESPEGCGQPDYTVMMQVEAAPIEVFNPRTPQLADTWYEPITEPKTDDWAGAWRDADDWQSARTHLLLTKVDRPIQVSDQYRIPGSFRPKSYEMRVTEELTDDTKLFDDTAAGPVSPALTEDFRYYGDVTPGQRKLVISPDLDFTAHELLMRFSDQIGRGRQSMRSRIDRRPRRVLAPELVDLASVILPPGAQAGIDMQDAITSFDDNYGLDLADLFETEEGSTLEYPELGVTLRLYTRHDTMVDGRENSYTVMRYGRAGNSTATRSEYELMKYRRGIG